MIYEWKQKRFQADAQKVGQELEKIPTRTAEEVVKTAQKKKGSELHKCFEWDDSKAAHAHRLEQARLVLRMIVTTVDVQIDGKIETVRPRAYESIVMAQTPERESKAMVYVPTREALSDDFMRAQVIGRLRDTIEDAEHTAEVYTHLVPGLLITSKKLKEAKETLAS